MAGNRRAVFVSIPLGPGVLTNTTGRGARTRINYMNWDRWKDATWVRWHKLLPEKQGGWKYQALTDQSGVTPALYLGLARDVHDWSSIDGQYWIAIGTHLKLYVVNQATLYDITPARKTSNVANAIQTFSGLTTVNITDVGHQANTGDYVTLQGATAVGGLTLAGQYPLTVIDPNTYSITAASAATSGSIGGGSFSLVYDISVGLPSNGELLGYGTGVYGAGTYGTPRAAGTGVFARLRTWSLDNYGQDLIASQSDGEIYWWQKNSGPNSRAGLLTNAPQGCQRVLVDAQQRVIIALGCTDVTGVFNAMLVRWCSFNNITDWFPTAINTAGDDILVAGSRIITGLKTKGQNLIFTDTTLYRMVFVGQPDIYDFIPAGTVTIVGPNAAVDVDGVAYFMGFDNFYNYSGTLNLQACDVWETVFDPNVSTSLLKTQSEKVVCYTYEPKTEITWLYPSIGGSGENDRYVTFNWDDGVWYCGAWNRTCAMGRAPAMGGYPYGVNGGYLYQHEIGTDAVEASGTQAIGFYMKSLDITVGGAKSEYTMGGSDARFAIGGSDSHLLLRSMLPDWAYFTGAMNLTIFTKDRPQDAAYVQDGPVQFTSATGQIDIDAHGSQLVIELDNYTILTGQTASLLLHMDGNAGSTSFPDASVNNLAVTAVGSAQVSILSPRFGTGAASFSGSNPDRLETPIITNGPLDLSTGDFTAECWVNFNTFAGNSRPIFSSLGYTGSLQGWQVFYDATSGHIMGNAARNSVDGPNINLSVTPGPGVWIHVAFVRQGNLFTTFVNGTGGPSVSVPGNIGPLPANLRIGGDPSGFANAFNGFIDEARIVKGLAVYTGNFTPPTAPFLSTPTLVASLGCSFRMGILQGLALPYSKR